MSLKNDLMYPFGNPLNDKLQDHRIRTSLNNVLKLAEDKVRHSRGDMEEILLAGNGGGSADDMIAEQSITIVQELMQYIYGQEETDT